MLKFIIEIIDDLERIKQTMNNNLNTIIQTLHKRFANQEEKEKYEYPKGPADFPHDLGFQNDTLFPKSEIEDNMIQIIDITEEKGHTLEPVKKGNFVRSQTSSGFIFYVRAGEDMERHTPIIYKLVHGTIKKKNRIICYKENREDTLTPVFDLKTDKEKILDENRIN